MDAKDLRTESALGDRSNDGNSKYPQGNSVLQCNRNKPYQDIGSNTLAKVDAQTARPCAVIGPDRVVPPPVSIDAYLKKGPVEPWSSTDNTYRRPPEYPHKLNDYHHPTRNISPRQTFQENMQRIMVPPSYNSSKIKEDHNFPVDANIPALRNDKLNVPAEAKYCDVPYAVNTMTNEQKTVRNTDIGVSNMNPALARSAHHGWPPANANIRPPKPYPASDMYQYPEYQSCAGPRPMLVPRPHRTVQEDPGHVYSDPYYAEGSVRFKPYPSVKERYPQTRYEYISNYTNPYPPPPFPSHKYELQKPLPHGYPGYSQVPLKYLDTRMAEPIMNGYQRPLNQPGNFPTVQYRNQVIHPNYGPIPGNCLQSNKFYPYPPDTTIKAMTSNKLPYDANHKIYGDYENTRAKPYPMSENFYVNEMARSHSMKGQVLPPNYPAVNMHTVPPHPYYRKENPTMKNYEYGPHFRNIDSSMNINGNILSRFPSQFSPNAIAISPSDSNTSNDTTQTQGTSQEDCGYISQSSTASIRSVESGLTRIPNDMYRRFDYRYGPIVRTSPLISKLDRNSNTNIGSKNKKDIDVRQFLQMWNEGEEENGENNNKDITVKAVPNNSNNIGNRYEASNKDQLYVLGLVNVPSEELGKYEHIQKVSKLPENIKGYNSIELLNQFEEVIESSNLNNYHVKPTTSRDFHISLKNSPSMQGIGIPSRPISPLDVEAKISQSVIHKEVGCNFEIKPCSPKMLNVEVATPIQTVLGERLIEKVSNSLITQSPILHSVDEKMDNCNNIKHREHRIDLNEKVTSCKLINTQCSSNEPVDSVKTNYSFQDLESNSGVCLASLPRLDNDIELNFPEVNQQFINANKVESVITTTPKDLPTLDIEQSEMLQDQTVRENEPNHFSPTMESPKLSKYRKLKRKGTETKDSQTNAQAMRTDSVIIKNPENMKTQEEGGDGSSPSVRKSTQDAQQDPINLTIHAVDRLNANSDLKNTTKDDIAIDFSLHSNEHFGATSNLHHSKANIVEKFSDSICINSPSDNPKDVIKFTKLGESNLNIHDFLESTNSSSKYEENKFKLKANTQKGIVDDYPNNTKSLCEIDINSQISSDLANTLVKSKVGITNNMNNEVMVSDSSHSDSNENFNKKRLVSGCINKNTPSPDGNSKIQLNLKNSVTLLKDNEIVDHFLPIENKNEKYADNGSHKQIEKSCESIDTNLQKVPDELNNEIVKPKNSNSYSVEQEKSTDVSLNYSQNNKNGIPFIKLTRKVNKELFSPWIQKLILNSEGLCLDLSSYNPFLTINTMSEPTNLDSILMNKKPLTNSNTVLYNHQTKDNTKTINTNITDIFGIEPNHMVEKTSNITEILSDNASSSILESFSKCDPSITKNTNNEVDSSFSKTITSENFEKIGSEPCVEEIKNNETKHIVHDNAESACQVEIALSPQSLKITSKTPPLQCVSNLLSECCMNDTESAHEIQRQLKVNITNNCDEMVTSKLNLDVPAVNSCDDIAMSSQSSIINEICIDDTKTASVMKPKIVNIHDDVKEIVTTKPDLDRPAVSSCVSAELIDNTLSKLFVSTESVVDNSSHISTSLLEHNANSDRALIDDKTIKLNAQVTDCDHCDFDVNDDNKECKSDKIRKRDVISEIVIGNRTIVESISQSLNATISDTCSDTENVENMVTKEFTYNGSNIGCSISNNTNINLPDDLVDTRVNNMIDKTSSAIGNIEQLSDDILNDTRPNSEFSNIDPLVGDVDNTIILKTRTAVTPVDDDCVESVQDKSMFEVNESDCYVDNDMFGNENKAISVKEQNDVADISIDLDATCLTIENSQPKSDNDIGANNDITEVMLEDLKQQCHNDHINLTGNDVEFQPNNNEDCGQNNAGDSKSIKTAQMHAIYGSQIKYEEIEVKLDNNSCNDKKMYNPAQRKSYEETVLPDLESNCTSAQQKNNLLAITIPPTIYQTGGTEDIMHKQTDAENNKDIIKLDNESGKNTDLDTCQELFNDCDEKRVNLDQFKPKESQVCDIFKNVRFVNNTSKRKRNSLKRSLSDSALDACNVDLHGNAILDDSSNGTLLWPNKRKRIDTENVNEPHFITESYCNIVHHNRRNSISSIYNEENVSFCILIDNNCIITEDCDETEKICFTEIPEECLSCMSDASNEEGITETSTDIITLQEEMNYEYAESFVQDGEEENLEETWVEDVACVETVVSDDVAEDILVSAPTSPKDSDLSDCESSNDEVGMFNVTNHTDKVKYIYGDKMCSDDAQLVETLYRTPQMDVNKTLVYRESHVMEDCSRYYDKESLEKILSESNSHEVTPRTLNDIALDSASLYAATSIKPSNEKDSLCLDMVNDTSSSLAGKRNETNISNALCENIEFSQNLPKTQDDTIHSCESSVDNVFSYNQRQGSPKCTISSSPEVSSTTSEDKSSGILLKITNYTPSRIEQINNINSENNSNRVSCKYTEKKDYLNSNSNLPNRPLITKAAQKYIPPLKETIGDLKVKLPLPQHSLIKLKQLKISKEEPKLNKNNPKVDNMNRKEYPKKPKPKFEDVLKSIDEIQFKRHKEKTKKIKSIPKVVIKKSENGSHYASTSNKDKYNPDLTGRKWQPWVFLERDNFIEQMALKKKTRAIFSHRKNTYVLAETFKKYKSISSAKFIISQPKSDESSSGQLKYTIRLKHNY